MDTNNNFSATNADPNADANSDVANANGNTSVNAAYAGDDSSFTSEGFEDAEVEIERLTELLPTETNVDFYHEGTTPKRILPSCRNGCRIKS